LRKQNRDPSFGASAFFILSDGMEAQTSVHLTFGSGHDAAAQTPESPAPSAPRPVLIRSGAIKGSGTWQMPDVSSRIVDVSKKDFRLRFSSQTWAGRIHSAEVLADQKISSPEAARLEHGADYCAWHPVATDLVDRLLANEPDTEISYTLEGFDKNSLEAASIVFYMKTHAGNRIGTLQCFFPHAESAAKIDFDRWVSIVGAHLTLEVRH
jgi:hypothetical protein